MEIGDPLISPQWLKDHIEAPDIRLVDATWSPPFLVGRKSGRELYNEAHLPGAVFFDIDEIADPKGDFPHTFPDPVRFSSSVRKLGLGDGHRIVIYDHGGFFASARVWWMFRAMGHKDVTVLDGGFPAWLASGGETDDMPPVPAERHFTPRVRSDLVRDKIQMKALIGSGKAAILDARSPGRFAGTEPEPREGLKSGHMPGSANIPADALITPAGSLKSAPELHAILGPYLNKPVVTTCGSGVSAAIISLALARLGHWDAAVYDGSWTEWASDASCPIETA